MNNVDIILVITSYPNSKYCEVTCKKHMKNLTKKRRTELLVHIVSLCRNAKQQDIRRH